MARTLLCLTAAVALLAATTMATPTTPFVSEAYIIPTQYLVRTGVDALAVVSSLGPNDDALAYGQYNRSNADIGWDYLKVGFDARHGDQGYYYAGYLEGYFSSAVMILDTINTVPTGAVGQWIEQHMTYIETQANSLYGQDKFWAKVRNMIALMKGIADGATVSSGQNITYANIFMINFQSELPDIYTAVQVQQQGSAMLKKQRNTTMPLHCSALIKVTETDLFVAHDTWDVFQGMTYRIHKVYAFGNDPVVVFAAHPAYIASADDWYQTSNQLAIQETTNEVYNLTLYNAVVPHTVSEFLRVIAATLLANSGEEWTLYFSRENSGTYNNQYMVVDFKLYAPGSTIVPNTLWIAEQLPGIVARGDVSNVLASQGYWASYNIPYFPYIFNISGNLEQEQQFGSVFSYSKYARPEIFKRNSSSITTLADMQRMMRYNHYETDPFSLIPNCTGAPNNQCLTPYSAMLSIASRGDLMPVYNSTAAQLAHYGPVWDFMSTGCFGAIDSKIAAWSQRHTLKAYVISGPTNDDQPTFQWNTRACVGNPAPAQTPDVVDFPWVEFRIQPDPQ